MDEQQTEELTYDYLRVSEHFYSIQGEGPTMGRRAVFLRLAGCNLLCGNIGTWDGQVGPGASWVCDTLGTWMKGERLSFPELHCRFQEADFLGELERGAHLVVTGGEPVRQQDALARFLKILSKSMQRDIFVELETNGTLYPSMPLIAMVHQFNVSPKLSNSGVRREKRITDAIHAYAALPNSFFKFVVATPDDVSEAENEFILPLNIHPRRVYLMPPACTREELDAVAEDVIQMALIHGYHYSHRIQISVWDNKKGV